MMAMWFVFCHQFVEGKMELFDGSLNTAEILNRWYDENKLLNYGAIITFIGVVRDENGCDGLSFDIYEPLLLKWFKSWEQKASAFGAKVLLAHAKGDVLKHETSYISAVCSKQRKIALSLIDEFVEDFKANAPIWKYDLKDGKRIYTKERSQIIGGAGLLA